jgi:hypothetical protein
MSLGDEVDSKRSGVCDAAAAAAAAAAAGKSLLCRGDLMLEGINAMIGFHEYGTQVVVLVRTDGRSYTSIMFSLIAMC